MFYPSLTKIIGQEALYKCAFVYLLYSNKSTNNIMLIICLWRTASASFQLGQGIETNNSSVIVQSAGNALLFAISSGYIIRNKFRD